jgi:pyrimidine operon attenuation protein/uracil phosphoribosyltransferase
MAKINILGGALFDITISRLCRQLLENHDHFSDTVFLGLQPRGIFLAERLKARLLEMEPGLPQIPVGHLDATFHRDDFRRRDTPLTPSANKVPFLIEGKKVVLIDDVLFTGRTVRAALDAMLAFGRPSKVELLILIDRKYSRDVPVAPDYLGKAVNTIQSQRVVVEWKEQGYEADSIWLVNQA